MIRIATRKSPLARWQAEWVGKQLENAGHEVEYVLLTSDGDVNQAVIDGSQAVGLFTKTIQLAVLNEEADIAVHSLKDLPTQRDTGLTLSAVPPRAEVADCLVSTDGRSFSELRENAVIGTGSRRRAAQLLAKNPALKVTPIRGNVQTRMEKLSTEGLDGVILAEAGLRRLGFFDSKTVPLPLEWMLPAPGQGALGIECRSDDSEVREALKMIDDSATHLCVTAERALLRHLQAGCLAPVAGYASTIEDGQITLRAVVLSLDGTERLHADASLDADSWSIEACESLGITVAESLLSQGARPLIAAAK